MDESWESFKPLKKRRKNRSPSKLLEIPDELLGCPLPLSCNPLDVNYSQINSEIGLSDQTVHHVINSEDLAEKIVYSNEDSVSVESVLLSKKKNTNQKRKIATPCPYSQPSIKSYFSLNYTNKLPEPSISLSDHVELGANRKLPVNTKVIKSSEAPGIINCQTTDKEYIRVPKQFVKVLPLYKPCVVEGVKVILLEAHHCPGAVMFLFSLPEKNRNKVYLHTGDFRASPKIELYPQLRCHVNLLYLDTTYCDPLYDFPSQDRILDAVVSTVKTELEKHPSTLIVCGSYTIGKEKVFIRIAEAIQSKICANSDKLKILKSLENENLKKKLTAVWREAQVHVLSMNSLKRRLLKEHLKKTSYEKILAIKPTGWVFNYLENSNQNETPLNIERFGDVNFCDVPYSEHSSFSELKRFVQFLKPDRIIPTVNVGNKNSRQKMETLFKKWN
ncbi:DNA cross-link repair 1A protein [Nymphon striatum]|nr:DNA cross-link repair 1A protein [Nymphon striatum]